MNTIEQAREVAKRLSIGATIARERRIDHEFAVLADHASSAIESLIAELATLKAVALSDDGAGGEGMMLYIRNRELNAELARLKGQQPVQWQKRHQSRTDGLWENTNEHDAKWWRDNAKGWEVRPLFLAAGAQTIPAGYQLVPVEPTQAMCEAAECEWKVGSAQDMARREYKAMLAAAPVQAQEQRTKSFAETHPANPNAKCKCEHWQSCAECHPTAHKAQERKPPSPQYKEF